MSVQDHGLEVLKKAGVDIGITPKNDYAIQIKTVETIPISGTVALDSTSLAALENITVTVSNEVEIKNDSGSTLPISAASLPLPSGASTSALQTTGNTTLSTMSNELANMSLLLVYIMGLLDTVTGDSIHVNGSIGTTPASIPAVAGYYIKSFFIENTHATQILYFSVDGVNWKVVNPGDAYTINLFNLTQIQIKGSGAGTTYESIFNRRPS